MGRIATDLAAHFARADNLPDKSKLPTVSAIDALLSPSSQKLLATLVPSLASKRAKGESKPTEPLPEKKKTYVKYVEVKKNTDGKKTFVAHKGLLTDNATAGNQPNAGKQTPEKKNTANAKKDDKKGEDKQNAETNNAFTPAEDAKLRELKAAKASWKDIAQQMSKPQHLLKAHWKQIEGANVTGNAENSNDQKGQKDENKNVNKNANKEDEPDWKNMTPSEKRREGEKRKAEKAAGKGKGKNDNKKTTEPKKQEEKSKARESVKEKPRSVRKIEAPKSTEQGSEARFTMQEWLTLQNDAMFSFDELRLLAELLTKGANTTWDSVAARFFDKTGRRVHPMDIRDKFNKISKMQ